MNNRILHRFNSHRGTEVWIASISAVCQHIPTHVIEGYAEGHSRERTLQLACADQLASEMIGRPVNIKRDDEGAPFIPGRKDRISISHTDDFMAMIISREAIVALDIEIQSRNIQRIQRRFTTEMEYQMYAAMGLTNPLIYSWGVKECLFKAAPVTKVLFKEHLLVREVKATELGILSQCQVVHPQLDAKVSVLSRIFEPLVVSYIDQATYGHEDL